MNSSLPLTVLIGGPLDGSRWVVDNTPDPLLHFDVPMSGYVRYVASRPLFHGAPAERRVFYVHRELSEPRLHALIEAAWQDGVPLVADGRRGE